MTHLDSSSQKVAFSILFFLFMKPEYQLNHRTLLQNISVLIIIPL